jgi:zinc transport system ATP-binding protein
MDSVLELRDVRVKQGESTLLDEIHLDVERGRIHVIVGPNGAGKSTLLAAILGWTAFSGSIRCHFRGSGRIGFVPQSFAIDRTLVLTVAEFLALSRQVWPPVAFAIRSDVQRTIAALLDRVALSGFERRRLAELSGGELQRVLLANAIDPVPELLVLDEPASGLDRSASHALESILLALKETHAVTVLMVSHDLEATRRLADRVTVLARSIVRDGPPGEVLASGAQLPWI